MNTGRHEWSKFFSHRVTFTGGCVLWGAHTDGLGYGRATRTLGEVKTHRISWTMVNGPIPADKVIRHKCDTRNCVNPDHLELGTQAQNVADMVSRGRLVTAPLRFGVDNAMSVLTPDDVWNIRFGLIKLFTQKQIAAAFKVAPMTISRLVNGKSWPHITQTTMT